MNLDTQAPSQTPSILVVFGATGDLMHRKLSPSLLNLYEHQLCPERFRIIGIARSDFSDQEFQAHIKEGLDQHQSSPSDQQAEFLTKHRYHQGDFTDPEMYRTLQEKLEQIDDEWGICTNKLFYLAVPPQHYQQIFHNLSEAGLSEPCAGGAETGWSRLLLEKPIGRNLQQAREIEDAIEKLFEPEQIYRVDHYLAKEPLQNVLPFRFSNNLLEQRWDRSAIEKIEVKLWEELDIEGRGSFYDDVGALLDVGQNHLLEMLALATMDQPNRLTAEEIRRERGRILNSLLAPEHGQQRGQYRGYRQASGIADDSQTETFFRVVTYLDHPNWHGVPIQLEAGKQMPETEKKIIITFKHPQPCLCAGNQHYQNQVEIRIEPDPGIAIKFWAKHPESRHQLEEQWLEFAYPTGDTRYTAEYTQLLLDALKGDLTLFVSAEENLASWEFTESVVDHWQASDLPLVSYTPDNFHRQFHQPVLEQETRGEIGLVGLGKMGANIGRRLAETGWEVAGFDPAQPEIDQFETFENVKALAEKLEPPRTIWLMVPHQAVDEALFGNEGLAQYLEANDVVIDGGNSFYQNSIERAEKLAAQNIEFIDVGVSGGPEGARRGASLMVGGKQEVFDQLETLFQDLSVPGGYAHFEGAGAGHFVKMVHNGIEYGMMQSIAEGFTVLKEADYNLDLSSVAEVYNHGSVIESRLVAWLKDALVLEGQNLEEVSGQVSHSGEGQWTVETAEEMGLKAKIIKEALQFRIDSQDNPSYTGKILSALRYQFGGHDYKEND